MFATQKIVGYDNLRKYPTGWLQKTYFCTIFWRKISIICITLKTLKTIILILYCKTRIYLHPNLIPVTIILSPIFPDKKCTSLNPKTCEWNSLEYLEIYNLKCWSYQIHFLTLKRHSFQIRYFTFNTFISFQRFDIKGRRGQKTPFGIPFLFIF